jgi:Flp pilus assembly protein TadG
MVETAFVIFILLSLTVGLVQYGFIYNAMLTLNNLAREGARYAAVRAGDTPNTPAGRTQFQNQVQNYLLSRARGTIVANFKPSTVQLSVQAPKLESNSPVRVVIKYDLVANQGFVPALVPLGSYYRNYEASAVNLIE